MGISDDQLDEAAKRFIQTELARQFYEDFAYIGSVPNIGPRRRRKLRLDLYQRYKKLGLAGVTHGRSDRESDAGGGGEAREVGTVPPCRRQEDT